MNATKVSQRAYRVTGALTWMLLFYTACGGSPPSGTGGTATGGAATGGAATGGKGGGAELCGNGVIDPQETCDTTIAAGEPGACLTSCSDGASCTTDKLGGAGTCEAACTYEVITTCASGDGCCPSGCTSASDADCSKTCGNGLMEAGEKCDTAIAPAQPGSCPTSCNDGLACTTDTLLGAGTCDAQCAHAAVSTCTDGDGCCPSGCPSDSDCTALSRIRQTVITDSGQTNWFRNGYWDGAAYKNWTPFSGQGMSQLVPQMGNGQMFRGIDHVVLGDGRVKVTALQMDGSKAWYRYATWDGSGYSNWTSWSDQFGDLTQIVPGQPTPQAYRSFDHVVLPDGRLKQTLLTFDGKKIWYRYGTWNGTAYATWTAWTDQWGDLIQLIPNQGTSQSFRSFNHVLLADKRLKQAVLSEDGHTVWARYAAWDAGSMSFPTWTPWSSQYGNLTQLLPGQGSDQAYLGWDEGALAGTGVASGCVNGCDDGDPCTVDSCVANSCQHAAVSCDDGNGCTTDVCSDGACQYLPVNCDDGDACTTDACVGGSCQHAAVNCDDGNPCTDDWCAGTCQHGNNTAQCSGGGQCQNGACSTATCTCNGCKDSCTQQPCNQGAVCAPNATCQNGICACPTPVCGGACCGSGDSCSGGKCCPTALSAFCDGKCGNVTGPCGVVNCGGCNGPTTCCLSTNTCDDICP